MCLYLVKQHSFVCVNVFRSTYSMFVSFVRVADILCDMSKLDPLASVSQTVKKNVCSIFTTCMQMCQDW